MSTIKWSPTTSHMMNGSPGTIVTGSPGSGKTFALLNMAANCLGMGQRVIAFDPKNDFNKLKNIDKNIKIIDINNISPGSLNPFIFLKKHKADGTVENIELEFEDNAAVCVVLASEGYTVSYEKEFPITGLEEVEDKDDYYCFHAGTKLKDGKIVTNGGRVLGVTAKGDDLKQARANAYQATTWVEFDNKYMRTDIGKAIDEA